ncbi:hypothetical protein MMG00_09910 [Ignatzschineria rhizosphaerae]|uniref:Uncharacterized protein n=1 Tax=Ignatzschineria rhizosphaerae TaxID=2923279 RepID=A0ABY3X441_9GAMM|nr:hypothetical protein [Ignatzschineria rhizosphaerae]UNM95535.1 hypothetical protein MMG00_09910 [Ignatzschineria rhizosphaerae]
MGVFLMVLAVLGLLGSQSIKSVLASTIMLVFGMWVHGAFDQILGG